MGQSKIIMKFTTQMTAVGNALTKQGKASDATNDHRFSLAVALYDANVDLNNAEIDLSIKTDLANAYPKGIGKKENLCPVQAKAVSAVRQVLCCYRKGCSMFIDPKQSDTYSEYRLAVYGDAKPLSKIEQVIKWLSTKDADGTFKLTCDDLRKVLDEYQPLQAKDYADKQAAIAELAKPVQEKKPTKAEVKKALAEALAEAA
jgi:hypothetical protein